MFTADIQEYQDNHVSCHANASMFSRMWLQRKLAVDFMNRLGFVYVLGNECSAPEHRFAPGTYSPVTINDVTCTLNISNPPYTASNIAMFSAAISYTHPHDDESHRIVTQFDALSNSVSVTCCPDFDPVLSVVLHTEEAHNFSAVISQMIEAFVVVINHECLWREINPRTALEYALEDAWVRCDQSRLLRKELLLSNKDFADFWIRSCVTQLISVREHDSYLQHFQRACHDVLTECYCEDSVDFSGFPEQCSDISKLAENLLPFLCQAMPFAPFGI